MGQSELCGITELPKDWCAHCRALRPPEPEPLHWFPARFDGCCARCGGPIQAGQDIASTDHGYICRQHHDQQ